MEFGVLFGNIWFSDHFQTSPGITWLVRTFSIFDSHPKVRYPSVCIGIGFKISHKPGLSLLWFILWRGGGRYYQTPRIYRYLSVTYHGKLGVTDKISC